MSIICKHKDYLFLFTCDFFAHVGSLVLLLFQIMVRVGIVGFGHLGQYLVEKIHKHPGRGNTI